MLHIHFRLTTGFINRTSWLSLRTFKQTNAVSSIGERRTENYLFFVFLCSEVWFHSWEQHWYNSRHYCCVIVQH